MLVWFGLVLHQPEAKQTPTKLKYKSSKTSIEYWIEVATHPTGSTFTMHLLIEISSTIKVELSVKKILLFPEPLTII